MYINIYYRLLGLTSLIRMSPLIIISINCNCGIRLDNKNTGALSLHILEIHIAQFLYMIRPISQHLIIWAHGSKCLETISLQMQLLFLLEIKRIWKIKKIYQDKEDNNGRKSIIWHLLKYQPKVVKVYKMCFIQSYRILTLTGNRI